ncbi:aminopeptidase P family protein [Candidatus Woesearchaeota archaeon]|nr:aminopeptidase P family protein [Candidatus Woesearchaeota archaeon]
MRHKELQKILMAKNLDGALFLNLDERPNASYIYFTDTDALGILFIPAKGIPDVFIPAMEMSRAKTKDCNMHVLKRDAVKNHLKKKKVTTLGIEFSAVDHMTFTQLKKSLKVTFKDITKEVTTQRNIKDKTEISRIKAACKATDKLFNIVLQHFKDFKSEADIAAFMEYHIRKMGLVKSFDPVIASGKNAGAPHHIPTTKPLQKGFLVMDFGVKYKHYCSDMTRTIYVGSPSIKDIELYKKLYDIQIRCIALSTPGTKAKDIDDYARQELGEPFNHSLGHGLGIDVHEHIPLSPGADIRLEPGMVFTIEPGYYLSNKLGIRIEDDMLMTEKGAVSLNKSPKDLIIMR